MKISKLFDSIFFFNKILFCNVNNVIITKSSKFLINVMRNIKHYYLQNNITKSIKYLYSYNNHPLRKHI